MMRLKVAILAGLMLLTGSVNTIATKYQVANLPSSRSRAIKRPSIVSHLSKVCGSWCCSNHHVCLPAREQRLVTHAVCWSFAACLYRTLDHLQTTEVQGSGQGQDEKRLQVGRYILTTAALGMQRRYLLAGYNSSGHRQEREAKDLPASSVPKRLHVPWRICLPICLPALASVQKTQAA